MDTLEVAVACRQNNLRQFLMSWLPGWNSIASAHWWENLYFWAGIVALILLGVMEVVSHRYTERKDELASVEQGTIQRQHEEEIARLHLQTAELTADAEKSRAAIADATARAAEANQIAERERLARIKLEKALEPRRINAEQAKVIGDFVRDHLPNLVIAVTRWDVEAQGFAREISMAIAQQNHGKMPTYELLEKPQGSSSMLIVPEIAKVLRNAAASPGRPPSPSVMSEYNRRVHEVAEPFLELGFGFSSIQLFAEYHDTPVLYIAPKEPPRIGDTLPWYIPHPTHKP
jgi:hypothetical protein